MENKENISRSSNFRTIMHQRNGRYSNNEVKPTLELDEDFYSDLDDFLFLYNNAESIGLTDKEIQIVSNQINRKVKDAVNVDSVSFLGEIYNRRLFILENCLPVALRKDNREKTEIPEEYKKNLTELYRKFKTATLKEKIALLEDQRTWGIREINGYVIGNLDLYSDLDSVLFEDVEDELEYNPLYSALTLLDKTIAEQEQGQHR